MLQEQDCVIGRQFFFIKQEIDSFRNGPETIHVKPINEVVRFIKGYLRYKTILCHKVALDV